MFNPLSHPICLTQPLRLPDDPSTPNWVEHVPFAMLLVEIARPKVIVELGTHAGISYCGFCQAVSELGTDTRCYAIDTWQGDEQAGTYGPEVLQDLRAHHDPRYSGFSRLVQSTFDDALEQFPDGSVDLLHIDGCHSYDMVKHDFEQWLPKLTDRAIVLMHDINVRERQFGVWKLWDELGKRYPHRAFTHGNGLGILIVGQYPSDEVQQLVEMPDDSWSRMRQFFYQLGSRLTTQYTLAHNTAWLSTELAQKDQHVQNIERQNAEREQHIQNFQVSTREQAAHIENLDVGIREQAAHIESLNQHIAARDLQIQTAEQERQQLALSTAEQFEQQSREIQRGKLKLANRVRAVEALTGQVRDKDTHIRNLDSIITDREYRLRQIVQVVQERDQLAQRLNSIETRASWQLLHRLWEVQMRVAAPATPQGRAWLALTKGARFVLPRHIRRRSVAIATPVNAPDANVLADLSLISHPSGEQGEGYADWLERNEPSQEALALQNNAAASLTQQPLFSIVTPVYETPIDILRATIDSVRAQTYPTWEWCIADGASTDPDIKMFLDTVAAEDARIRVQYLTANFGITGNSNAAAALAVGTFIVLLDHDDTLAPNALFEVAQAINERPDTDIVYFDEDKLSEDGKERSEPFLKPDWSPEMLLSANYLMHSVIRRDLFMTVGGFAEKTEGAQDWDLMLRCTERSSAVVHIPKILYHWRQLIGSTAATYEAKPYVFENQLRVVQEHLRRRGIATARTRFIGQDRLQAFWPTTEPLVSIIIPTKEKVELLRPCLNSLLQLTGYTHFEVILVDNGSQHPDTLAYYEELRHDSRVSILDYPHPFNYSAANNFGASHAQGEILLFLNNDIEVLEPQWLEELVRWAERPEIGTVGAKLLYPDGKIQHAGVIIGMEGHASHVFWGTPEHYAGPFGSTDWYRDYSAITGACMMLRASLFEEIGRFDEAYELAFSDIEICLRAKAKGYRNLYTPFARLRHHEGGSRGQYIPVDDILLGYDHMKDDVATGDPYYNPNLSYATRVPELSGPNEESRVTRLRRLCGVEGTQDESEIVPVQSGPHATGAVISQPAQPAKNFVGTNTRTAVERPVAVQVASPPQQPIVADTPIRQAAAQGEISLPYYEALTRAAVDGKVLQRKDIYGSGPPNETANPEIVSLLLQHCQAPVLDVGCGIGVYVAALHDRGIIATGLEIDPAYVSTAQALKRNVQLYAGDSIPFEDGTFDTAIAIEVLEHIPDWEHTLREMIRVARRCVVISVPNIGAIPAMSRHLVVPWHLLEGSHENFFTREILEAYLRRIPGITSTVTTYGEFRISGEVFHNHVFAVIQKQTDSEHK